MCLLDTERLFPLQQTPPIPPVVIWQIAVPSIRMETEKEVGNYSGKRKSDTPVTAAGAGSG
jgi:hypothetical protein